jgi:hypothetical protein
LGGLEGEDRDFGWAVETQRKTYGADASVDVKLHLAELVVTHGIFFAHGGEDKGAQEGQANLSSVGVAGEHEIDQMAAGVGDDGVGVIGLVGHENYGCAGGGWDGEIEVGMAGAGIFEATDPEAVAIFLDSDVLVDEDGRAATGEGLDDQGGVISDVVIAENGIAKGSGEGGDDLGTAMGCVVGDRERERSVGDEVAGEQDEIGGENVDFVDDALEEEGFGVFVEVDVAKLHDAIAVEGAGQIGDGDGAVDYIELVPGNLPGVEGHACCEGAGTDKEVSSCKARRLIGLGTGHSLFYRVRSDMRARRVSREKEK